LLKRFQLGQLVERTVSKMRAMGKVSFFLFALHDTG
jgi:hypothetical protein